VNTGTNADDGGVVNTGNNASKGGTIQTGSNDVGGDVHNTTITNSGARTWSLLKVSTDQTLNATVSDNHVGGWQWNGTANTGAVSLNESGFAGVQTASSNSGLNSANQAATAVAANASITFGNVR
jgi:hypothetical protein